MNTLQNESGGISENLMSKAQKLFTQETADDIIRGIFKIKEILPPNASDDDILTKAKVMHQEVVNKQPTNMPVEQVSAPVEQVSAPVEQVSTPTTQLSPKEQVLDKYSLQARENILARQKEESSGPAWAAGLAALGAGIAGRDAGAAGQGILSMQQKARENELSQFDTGRELQKQGRLDELTKQKTARENDPNSDESKTVQELAKKYMPGTDFSKSSATFLLNKLPFLEKAYAVDVAAQGRKDMLAQQARENEFKRQEKASTMGAKNTEGQKAVDKDFAKDYNDWTSGGQATVDKNLKRLQNAKNILVKRKDDTFGTSGRLTGMLPDVLRSEESKQLREDVQAAAQGALKATLGTQFTEKEGERIMKAAYNENLSPEANIAKIDAAIKELETAKQNKNAKSSYFEKLGTLTGFKSENVKPKAETKVVNGKTYKKVPNGWEKV